MTPDSGVEVDSTMVALYANAQGSQDHIIGVTLDNNGSYYCSNCIQPAGWVLTDINGPHCGGQTGPPNSQGVLASNHVLTFACGPIINQLGFLANPTPYNLDNPSDLNLTGSGTDTTYGQPLVGITDDVGTILYQGQADGVSPDNQTVTIGVNHTASLYPGAFYAAVANQISDGSYYVFGGANFTADGTGGGSDPCPEWCSCHPCYDSRIRPSIRNVERPSVLAKSLSGAANRHERNVLSRAAFGPYPMTRRISLEQIALNKR